MQPISYPVLSTGPTLRIHRPLAFYIFCTHLPSTAVGVASCFRHTPYSKSRALIIFHSPAHLLLAIPLPSSPTSSFAPNLRLLHLLPSPCHTLSLSLFAKRLQTRAHSFRHTPAIVPDDSWSRLCQRLNGLWRSFYPLAPVPLGNLPTAPGGARRPHLHLGRLAESQTGLSFKDLRPALTSVPRVNGHMCVLHALRADPIICGQVLPLYDHRRSHCLVRFTGSFAHECLGLWQQHSAHLHVYDVPEYPIRKRLRRIRRQWTWLSHHRVVGNLDDCFCWFHCVCGSEPLGFCVLGSRNIRPRRFRCRMLNRKWFYGVHPGRHSFSGYRFPFHDQHSV